MIRRALRAATLCALAVLGGCGQFDAQKATTAEIFSDRKLRTLAEAAEKGDVATIDALVKQGLDVNAKGRGGVTPLLRSLLQNNKVGYEALLCHGADPNVLDAKGHAVTHRAAAKDDPFWLRLALKHGGNPNLINTGNRQFPNETPLYYAIHAGGLDFDPGRPESVKLLIAAGADLNHKIASGSNPLIEATQCGTYEIVLLLLEAGADFEQKDREGESVVDWLRGRDERVVFHEEQRPWFRKVVAFLEAKGVDMTPRKRG